jgi:hypothetical protein
MTYVVPLKFLSRHFVKRRTILQIHSRSLNLDPEHQTVAILQSQESYADTPVSSEHDAIEMMIRTLHSLLVSVCLFTLRPLLADQGRVADYSFRVVGGLPERTLSVR